LAWALLGRRESRRRRLRAALAYALLCAAGVLSAVALFYLAVLPSSMQVIRPDFRPPFHWGERVLAIAVPLSLLLSVGFVIRALYRSPGARKQLLLA
jgi:hypothetical protein